MKKTSVYLTEEEAEDLRRLAVREGRPQAELIREGIHRLVDESEGQSRTFHSLGLGRGGGRPYEARDSAEVYSKVFGRD